jgi:hypothetical protein
MMNRQFTLLLATLLGCHGAAPRSNGSVPQQTAAMDSGTVRRLCAEPDSVLAGRRSCVLLDQRAQRVVPKPIH